MAHNRRTTPKTGALRRYRWVVRFAPDEIPELAATVAEVFRTSLSHHPEACANTVEVTRDAENEMGFEVRAARDLEVAELSLLQSLSTAAMAALTPGGCVAGGPIALLNPEACNAITSLPSFMAAYLEQAAAIVSPVSTRLSAETREEVARHAPRAMGREVACCHLDDDGNLFVVTVDPVVTVRTLRHEAIHAAQVHADGGEMEAAFKAAAETGRAITEAIGADQADGRHRDLTWMRKAASRADVRTLKLARTIHPFEDTAAVAAELGVQDREAVAASSFAAALLESGFDDWTGDLACEVVAYRFQDADHPALKALFTSARQGFARRAEANQG